MLKRTILATFAVCALAVGIQAQVNATLVMRSGEKVTGELVDFSAQGFTVRVDGQTRAIPKNEVAVVDFAGGGALTDAQWQKVGNAPAVVLRSGEVVQGELYDIGGTTPLRVTLTTGAGKRDLTSGEIASIVLEKPTGAVATTGDATAGIPEGEGIAVPATQQWTPTGLVVREGGRLTFNASGELQYANDPSAIATPYGAKTQVKSPKAPLPGVFTGALIAKVGEKGEPFPIGGGTQTVTMPATGQLFLGINDEHLADNKGGFRVEIKRAGGR